MTHNVYPRLDFCGDFSDRDAYEASERGFLQNVVVETSENKRYSIVFYSPGRLQQDLEAEAEWGRPYLAEPGLIVIPDVTLQYMEEAVRQLHRAGYFDSFMPLS